MRPWRCGVLAWGAAGALWLLAGAPAFAQEAAEPPAAPEAEAPATPAGEEPAEAEGREMLGEVVDTRSQGNEDAQEVQRRIETIADETDALLAQYRTALKQIDSLTLYNQQMNDLIAAQHQELGSLQDQLDRVENVGRSVTPLMLMMIDSIDRFVQLDLPFLLEERTKRIAELRKLMSRSDVTTAERFRQIMEAYQIENEYGRTIETYRSTLPRDGAQITVDFLRFGRIALLYQTLDEVESGMWNRETKSWEALDSSYRSPIRQGIKIARKQSAPDLISLPLPAPSDGRRSS
jgi:hypothetical protein